MDLIDRLGVADWAGRIEMGGFATLEAGLFGPGLVVMGVGLAGWPAPDPPTRRRTLTRSFAWALWGALLPATAWVVLNRLPP